MVDELKEKKARKNGEVTIAGLTKSLLSVIESGEVEQIVIVTKMKDGTINTGYTQANHLSVLGLLECGKDDIICEMKGW